MAIAPSGSTRTDGLWAFRNGQIEFTGEAADLETGQRLDADRTLHFTGGKVYLLNCTPQPTLAKGNDTRGDPAIFCKTARAYPCFTLYPRRTILTDTA
ncbi:MAG: hypothetical protein WBE06_08385 [Phycisphaerae bacterium]